MARITPEQIVVGSRWIETNESIPKSLNLSFEVIQVKDGNVAIKYFSQEKCEFHELSDLIEWMKGFELVSESYLHLKKEFECDLEALINEEE